MQPLLIVNADDFGLSKGQNYGIIEAHNNGLVTSTTALVNGGGIRHAVELSRSVPGLGVGMHFVLTLGEPLSAMPSLVREGRLGKWIWQRIEQGSAPADEIAHELDCQCQRFIALFGRPPTHIDSHHHIHMLTGVFPIVANFAREKGIPLRIDDQQAKRDGLALEGLRSSAAFSSAFYGESVSEQLFLQILDAALAEKLSSLEVMCHPSFVDSTVMESTYCYPRLTELDILTSPTLKQAIQEREVRLGTYQDLVCG